MSSLWIAVVGGFVGGLVYSLAIIVLCCVADMEPAYNNLEAKIKSMKDNSND